MVTCVYPVDVEAVVGAVQPTRDQLELDDLSRHDVVRLHHVDLHLRVVDLVHHPVLLHIRDVSGENTKRLKIRSKQYNIQIMLNYLISQCRPSAHPGYIWRKHKTVKNTIETIQYTNYVKLFNLTTPSFCTSGMYLAKTQNG